MTTGTVKLYHRLQVLRSETFRTELEREQRVSKWKKLYGKGFNKTTVLSLYHVLK